MGCWVGAVSGGLLATVDVLRRSSREPMPSVVLMVVGWFVAGITVLVVAPWEITLT